VQSGKRVGSVRAMGGHGAGRRTRSPSRSAWGPRWCGVRGSLRPDPPGATTSAAPRECAWRRADRSRAVVDRQNCRYHRLD